MPLLLVLLVTLFVMSFLKKRAEPTEVPVRSNSIPQKLPLDDRGW